MTINFHYYRKYAAVSGLLWLFACGDDEPERKMEAAPVGVDDTAGDAAPDMVIGDGGGTAVSDGGVTEADGGSASGPLPIVFIHGFAGSAQQYESQAIRFALNGYPLDRIRAFEHEGVMTDIPTFVAGADALIDEVRREFGVDQVYLVGHSRGTSVSNAYLEDAARAAKIAKYVALDGRPCPEGNSVPCLAPNQMNLPGQTHVEVATSAESFAMQYEFLFGMPAPTTTITPAAGPVQISGRIVNFPQNTGRQGTLRLFEIDSATGARTSEQPLETFQVGENGDWGPATVAPDKHYEFVMTGPESPSEHHFYTQRFLRDSNFVRLLSGPPDTATRMNTNLGAQHAALTVSRQREWLPSDVLKIGTVSASQENQPAVNIIKETIVAMDPTSGRVRAPIGLHVHDDTETPGVSTLAPLPAFVNQPFQTGIDVYMPAATPPDGTITLESHPRGDATKPQILNVPNWASSDHVMSVMFTDYPQD